MDEKKNGEGKPFKKEVVLLYGGEEKWRRKGRNIFGEGKYLFLRRRKKRMRKRRKIFGKGKYL